MLKFLLLFLCGMECIIGLISPPLKVPGYASPVYHNVFSSYNSKNNLFLVTWTDSSSARNPWFSIYNIATSAFSTPMQLPSYTSGVQVDVYSSYNSKNNITFLSWSSATSQLPWYSIYNFSSNTFFTAAVPNSNSYTAAFHVFNSYNSKDNVVFLSWSDKVDNKLVYAIYDVFSGGFSTQSKVFYSISALGDVFNVYNSQDNTVLLSWTDGVSLQPYYAIYSYASGSFSIAPTAMPSYSSGVKNNIFSAYNSANNSFLFSWADGSVNHNPWIAVYDASANLFLALPRQILNYSGGVNVDVFPSYSVRDNAFFLSWADSSVNHNPWLAFFDVSSRSFLTPPTQIPNYSNGVHFDVFCSYNCIDDLFFISWADITDSYFPWFSLYYKPTLFLKQLDKSSILYQKGVRN